MDPLIFFKSLADDTRLKSLLLIEREGELCVCRGQSQPTISRHLARLRRDGLLLDRRQGQWVFYRLHPELPDWARQVLTRSRRANGAFLQSCERALAAMGERPERDRICCA